MNDKLKVELENLAGALERPAEVARSGAQWARTSAALTPDDPIRSSADDRLNRSGFAAELARAIIGFDRAESVVVGIHGRWGTGKSSLLNMLDEQLQAVSPEAPVIFRFNPWGFSDKNQLSDRFFAELSAFLKLHMSIPSLSGMSETVEEYGQLLSPMARLIFPRAAEAVRFGWKWFRKYRPARQRSLAELKVQINLGLSDSGSKLIILIDDIDRLNNEEIREVFQLIKLNANFSNTVYVVAFDKNLVQKALRKVAQGRPQEYLEKIVQIPFDLPVIAESTLTEIIIANFNQILASVKLQKASTQRFGNMFHSGFRESFRTIRDVNRYFNLFKFAFNLMRHDTDFVDLAAVEAVALFYPVVYQAIADNPGMFVGGWGALDQRPEDREQFRAPYDGIFSKVAKTKHESVISLCRFLFPKLEHIYGRLNARYGPEWEASWQQDKRIASSKYFAYYFQLAVPETEVSQSEFNTTLNEATSVEALSVSPPLQDLQALWAIHRPIQRPRTLFAARETSCHSWVNLHVRRRGRDRGSTPIWAISEYMRFAMWLLYDILDVLQSRRFEILCEAMRRHAAVFTISDVAATFEIVAQDDPVPQCSGHAIPT